ncbi:MAG: ABC transporter permease [Clostridia bacterium]|nr:ABC transporter permease [Clostridia bacterium]NCC44136.1 ABC transporter permease [Clostridia bacterium]
MDITAFLLSMQSAVSQGILWGIMVLGVYITFRIMDIADMTVDGSFALGGCLCATLMIKGVNPILAILLAVVAGAAAGAVTGILHTIFEIPAILAGILTQISLWSINLRIMGQKSNIPLLNTDSIFTWIVDATGVKQSVAALIVGVIVIAIVVWLLYWFFGTEIGSALRATGNNEDMIRALGVNIKITKVLALMIGNALVALSGALICQSTKTGDIQMGTGAIVIGLAAIVIGEVLFGKNRAFGTKLISAAIGAVVYFVIRAIVLRLGMNPNDMKLISAIIVVLALCTPVMMGKWKLNKAYSTGEEK